MPSQKPGSNSSSINQIQRLLGKYPGRTLLRLGAALGGLWLANTCLGMIWPEPDQIATNKPKTNVVAKLAPLPKNPVTVLLVGIDADQINDLSNQAAPQGPANADSLILIRFAAQKQVEILLLPTELGVVLPGAPENQPLAASYRQGGVALTGDVIAQIVGLPEGEPQRFVVIPRQALRSLVNALGDMNVTLAESFNSTDNTQNYTVSLEAGPQTLNGSQVEQLVRYRSDPNESAGRRHRQKWVINGLAKRLRNPSTLAFLPDLINQLSSEVQTDLSQRELLSLAAAAIRSSQFPNLEELPLAPRAGEQTLRQLKSDLTMPLWPQNSADQHSENFDLESPHSEGLDSESRDSENLDLERTDSNGNDSD